MATAARDNLNLAADRALEYFDRGLVWIAFGSFLTDVGNHPCTAWIQTNQMTLRILQNGFIRGRDAFEAAMRGLDV